MILSSKNNLLFINLPANLNFRIEVDRNQKFYYFRDQLIEALVREETDQQALNRCRMQIIRMSKELRLRLYKLFDLLADFICEKFVLKLQNLVGIFWKKVICVFQSFNSKIIWSVSRIAKNFQIILISSPNFSSWKVLISESKTEKVWDYAVMREM